MYFLNLKKIWTGKNTGDCQQDKNLSSLTEKRTNHGEAAPPITPTGLFWPSLNFIINNIKLLIIRVRRFCRSESESFFVHVALVKIHCPRLLEYLLFSKLRGECAMNENDRNAK